MHLFNKNFKKMIVKTIVFLFSLNIGWADIIITEIADPNDSPPVRYIEIHNSGGSSVALTDYYIIRWTNGNDNATASTAIDLSSYTLAAAGGALAIKKLIDIHKK
jgi:hypothetical protein